jgi:hypothetical protein
VARGRRLGLQLPRAAEGGTKRRGGRLRGGDVPPPRPRPWRLWRQHRLLVLGFL